MSHCRSNQRFHVLCGSVLFGCATKQCDYLSVFLYKVKVRHSGISGKRGSGLKVINSKEKPANVHTPAVIHALAPSKVHATQPLKYNEHTKKNNRRQNKKREWSFGSFLQWNLCNVILEVAAMRKCACMWACKTRGVCVCVRSVVMDGICPTHVHSLAWIACGMRRCVPVLFAPGCLLYLEVCYSSRFGVRIPSKMGRDTRRSLGDCWTYMYL